MFKYNIFYVWGSIQEVSAFVIWHMQSSAT